MCFVEPPPPKETGSRWVRLPWPQALRLLHEVPAHLRWRMEKTADGGFELVDRRGTRWTVRLKRGLSIRRA